VTPETVTHKAVKHVSCSRCGRGKKLRRTRTFTETLKPLDRPEVILAVLVLDAEDWEPTGEHPPCRCPYFTDPR
jgi:hypothetical protein